MPTSEGNHGSENPVASQSTSSLDVTENDPKGNVGMRKYKKTRKLGSGDIQTLSLEKALQTDQFFRFRPSPKTEGTLVGRRVLQDGISLGQARIYYPSRKDQWLCPYFDPGLRSLRFRRKDGQDAEYTLDLDSLAQAKRYRPLLVLARAEGLLDKVPHATLPSLDLKTVLQSGYYTKNILRIRPAHRHPLLCVTYYLSTEPVVTRIKLDLCVDNPMEKKDVRSFPYVDDNGRLALWNVDQGKPFQLCGHHHVDGAIPPEVVKKRFPTFFTWAKQLGYWADV